MSLSFKLISPDIDVASSIDAAPTDRSRDLRSRANFMSRQELYSQVASKAPIDIARYLGATGIWKIGCSTNILALIRAILLTGMSKAGGQMTPPF